MSPRKASSSSGLVKGLVAALVVALVALAFLLGRESQRVESEPPVRLAEQSPPRPPPSKVEPAEADEPEAPPGRVEAVEVDEAATSHDPAEIEAYFQKMKSIQEGQSVSDPNAFAMELTKAATKGDTSGFETLISDTARMEKKVEAINPPPSCTVYHARSLALLAESRGLLGGLRDAIASKDLSALGSMSTKAQALQERAKQLEQLEKQIRSSD